MAEPSHSLSRRRFLRAAATTAGAIGAASTGRSQPRSATRPTVDPDAALIDRKAVVSRHNVRYDAVDLLAPLGVGNGEFAFTCDVTGLQSLAEAHRDKTPLNTMAQWAWHRFPNRDGHAIDKVLKEYDVAGRKVTYAETESGEDASAAWKYLRVNPHRIALARIALVGKAGITIRTVDLSAIAQTLDLWTGTIRSRFTYDDHPVEVTTAAHPTRDAVAFRIHAPGLLTSDGLAVAISFPAASDDWRNPDDWDAPATAHTTTIEQGDCVARFTRSQDDHTYHVRAAWQGGPDLARRGEHAFLLAGDADTLELSVEFCDTGCDADARPLDAPGVFAASAGGWEAFWTSGAAIDFGDCTDPRAPELERRVVLSQYLTAVHCAGSMPPQVSGLLFNSWYGKPQLEVHPFAAAHFATWGRFPLLERSLGYYSAILAEAQNVARRQGYEGARWPKMTDPQGRESPGAVGPFMVWQQPHPVYFAELAYRAKPTRETLERYGQLVEQSARFMASYAAPDAATGRYVLGPAIVPAQETYWQRRATTLNPTLELAYWAWGLGVAQKWRERLGRPREERWTQVLDALAMPTIREDRYAAIETEPFLRNSDHPSFLMAYGFVPKTRLIDEATMRRTARWAKSKWKWNEAWGCDFPMLAMTAARVGEPDMAVEALLVESERNRYLPNGQNFYTDRLPAYLPGNGALLAAIAMMGGRWDAGPDGPAPGFPKTGRWNVKCEGFARTI